MQSRLLIPCVLMLCSLTLPAISAARSDTQDTSSGVYSADEIMDADVYAKGGQRELGEVDDIIFGGDMAIKSFVVETDNKLGLAGKSYVVPVNKANIQMRRDDNEPTYRLVLDLSADQLARQQVYSDSWWDKTQKQANQAWQQTKKAADSAWTNIKQGTSAAVDSARKAVHSAAESASDATD